MFSISLSLAVGHDDVIERPIEAAPQGEANTHCHVYDADPQTGKGRHTCTHFKAKVHQWRQEGRSWEVLMFGLSFIGSGTQSGRAMDL